MAPFVVLKVHRSPADTVGMNLERGWIVAYAIATTNIETREVIDSCYASHMATDSKGNAMICRECGERINGLTFIVSGAGDGPHATVADRRAKTVYHRKCAVARAARISEKRFAEKVTR